jgi:hypothetical protein
MGQSENAGNVFDWPISSSSTALNVHWALGDSEKRALQVHGVVTVYIMPGVATYKLACVTLDVSDDNILGGGKPHSFLKVTLSLRPMI